MRPLQLVSGFSLHGCCSTAWVLCVAALFLLISGCATNPKQPTFSASQLTDMGEKCLAAGETANALKYLTEAAQKKPNDASIQYSLALAYDQRGLQDKALSHLQEALKLKPNYPEALNTIGAIYAARGQFEPARAAFQKALDDPFYRTPQLAAYNMGRLYEKKGDIDTALPYYQQAVKFDPNYGMAWIRIGQIMEQLHRDDEARYAYGNAVHASPDLAEAQLRFGVLSFLAGDQEAALQSLSRVGKLAPNTAMADEARKYLDKINAAATKRIRHHSDTGMSVAPAHISEPVSEPGPGPTSEPSVEQAHENPMSGSTVSKNNNLFVVQLGSFTDRGKAEEIKSRLQEKGYHPAVRAVKDKDLGEVFVIQFEPVNTASKASTLVTQLGSEIEGEPKIIKLPLK